MKVLDLTSNGVDNQGAENLGKALASNRKLTELNLTSNRVGLEGVASLFKCIAKNESLEIIRVSKIKISSKHTGLVIKRPGYDSRLRPINF